MHPDFVLGGPIPESLGAAVDLYAQVRELRLSMQKAVDTVKERETEIYKHMLAVLSESVDTGATGQNYRVQLVNKVSLSVTDWTQLHDYIRQTGAFELLSRRLSEPAARDMLDAGIALPGIGSNTFPTLSITKR